VHFSNGGAADWWASALLERPATNPITQELQLLSLERKCATLAQNGFQLRLMLARIGERREVEDNRYRDGPSPNLGNSIPRRKCGAQ
jgi:hypothetical protein